MVSQTRRELLVSTGAGTAGLMGLSGCLQGFGGSSEDELLLGIASWSGGRWDFLQPPLTKTWRIAVNDINDADGGGPLGGELEGKERSTKNDPTEARTVLEQFKETDEAVAVTNITSPVTVALWDFLLDLEMPINAQAGTTFKDKRGGDNNTPDDLSDDEWIWRTIPGDLPVFAATSKYLLGEGIETMGILHGTDQDPITWAEGFENIFEAAGGTVSKTVEFQEGQSTYRSILDRFFNNADFDGWAVTGPFDDVVTIIEQWDEAGYGRQLLIDNGIGGPDMIDAVGDTAEGAWQPAASLNGPNFDQYVQRFQNADLMTDVTDTNRWGTATYDWVHIAALAIERAGESSHDAIQQNIGPVARPGGTEVASFQEGKEELDNGNEINYQGAGSRCNFTGNGNVIGSAQVDRVTPGGYETLREYSESDFQDIIGEVEY